MNDSAYLLIVAIRFLRSKSSSISGGETSKRLSEGRLAAGAIAFVKSCTAPIAPPREHAEEAEQQILPPVPRRAMALFRRTVPAVHLGRCAVSDTLLLHESHRLPLTVMPPSCRLQNRHEMKRSKASLGLAGSQGSRRQQLPALAPLYRDNDLVHVWFIGFHGYAERLVFERSRVNGGNAKGEAACCPLF